MKWSLKEKNQQNTAIIVLVLPKKRVLSVLMVNLILKFKQNEKPFKLDLFFFVAVVGLCFFFFLYGRCFISNRKFSCFYCSMQSCYMYSTLHIIRQKQREWEREKKIIWFIQGMHAFEGLQFQEKNCIYVFIACISAKNLKFNITMFFFPYSLAKKMKLFKKKPTEEQKTRTVWDLHCNC